MQVAAMSDARRETLAVFLLSLLFFAIGLGTHTYLDPSEARYIEIPRQMLATGDWLTPRINGVPYFEKPPLFYWMQAITLNWFGLGEFSGRIVCASLMAGLCACTYTAGRIIYDRLCGKLAALVMATCLMGYIASRVATLDVPVSFFLCACLTSFLAAQASRRPGSYYLLMYVFAAVATMTKGLIGIVIPGLVIGGWVVLGWNWHILPKARLLAGLLVFLLITAPWHILMTRAHPDFLNFYVIHEHFTRFLTDEHKRTQAWWFFLPIGFAGLLPWWGMLPASLRAAWLERRKSLVSFLLLWLLLPFLFFSSSHSKLASYILPCFPAAAIMIGQGLTVLWRNNRISLSLRITGWLTAVSILAALTFLRFGMLLPGKAGRELAMMEAIPPLMLVPLLAVTGVLVIALLKRGARRMILALAACGAVLGLTLNFLSPRLDKSGTKPLSAPLASELAPDDIVVSYGDYWQDLPVYLNRNISIVNWLGELEFGVAHYPETKEWMLDSAGFKALCQHAKARLYVFTTAGFAPALLQDSGGCPLRERGRYGKTVLLENIP